jgi:site-specific recombinase XerD
MGPLRIGERTRIGDNSFFVITIRPIAQGLGITKRIGWHTFRRTYSTLLRATGAEFKVMLELMRHSTIRVTLDTYTQAVTSEKRAAQTAVVSLFIRKKRSKAA